MIASDSPARRIEFAAPCPPWSTNQERSMHWTRRHSMSKLWKESTFWHARQAGWRGLGPSIVTASIPFDVARRRDPHNYSGTCLKSIVDGLVLAGCWPDDTSEWVRTLEPLLTVGGVVVVEVMER